MSCCDNTLIVSLNGGRVAFEGKYDLVGNEAGFREYDFSVLGAHLVGQFF